MSPKNDYWDEKNKVLYYKTKRNDGNDDHKYMSKFLSNTSKENVIEKKKSKKKNKWKIFFLFTFFII